MFKYSLLIGLLVLLPNLNTSTTLPEPSYDKPVQGLEISCHPVFDNYQAGKPIDIRCRITNKTDSLKPFAWDHRGNLNFTFNYGDAYPPKGGTFMSSYPEIEESLLVKSQQIGQLNDIRRNLVFYLPPEYTLVFHLTLYPSDFSKPGEYSARITYDPEPLYSSDALPNDINEYKLKYLTSDVFKLKIVDEIK